MSTFDSADPEPGPDDPDDPGPDDAGDEWERATRDVARRLCGGELAIRRQAIELIVQTERYLRHVAGPGDR